MPARTRTGPRQINTANRVGAVFLRILCVLLSLCGPAVLVGGILHADQRWIILLMGVLTTAVGTPAGIALWGVVGRSRAATRRLEAVGVRAVAEILGITRIASGEEDVFAVELALSGPKLGSFTVTTHRTGRSDLRVGGYLQALVDPIDHSYTIVG